MSLYAWTLPAAAAGGVVPAAEDEQLRILGKDIKFDGDKHVSPSGDYVLVAGMEAMRQSIRHRLITKPGEYTRNPKYGVGVQLYVKRRRSTSVIDELRNRIIDQLSYDLRIEEVVAVEVEYITDGIQVAIKVNVSGKTLSFRPFQFTEKTPLAA